VKPECVDEEGKRNMHVGEMILGREVGFGWLVASWCLSGSR